MVESAALKNAERWMKQSTADLTDAEFVAASGRHALACFLCHQSAEKAVTSYLFARGAEMVWGHSLADLCEDAMAVEPSFDFMKSIGPLLDKHYMGARYPGGLPGGVPADVYEEYDSERALEIARDINQFARERIDQLPG